jgi:protein-disulfide isomerase
MIISTQEEPTMPHAIPRRTAIAAGLSLPGAAALAQAPGAQPFEPTAPGPDTPRPLPGERIIGRADAPVAVIEYHSLTCGNCARFHTEIFPRIRSAFIEPGLVRFVMRDFPLDRVALEAAAMVHCGGPERYEALISTLYANKESWAHSPDARAWLRRAGTVAGIPVARIDACMTDRGFTDPILLMRLQGEREFRVDATPSFVINGQVHRGVQSFERFSALVRPLLPAGAVPRG